MAGISVAKLKSKWMWLVVLLIIALIGGARHFAYKYNQAQAEIRRLSNPQEAAKAEVDELVGKVGQLVELPTGETPTLATVSDASKLKNQAFFAKAENGDKVLIYTQARRAVLYRPSTDKVIEIAPINIGSGNTQGANTENQPKPKQNTDPGF